MKKSDSLTAIGLVLGIGMLLWSMMSGSSLVIFIDMASVLITVGGSFCALLITYSLDDIKRVGSLLAQAFKENTFSGVALIKTFTNLSRKARREGLLSLEDEIAEIDDEFLRKGLQMVIDGIEPDTIKEILNLEIDEMITRHSNGTKLFQTWGAYAPGFGMIGTLIGLIQMMQNLTDASTIAIGMGRALLTTLYGSLLANLFCLPVAANLKNKSDKEVEMRSMIVEGVLSIQSGVNPRIVEEKLLTYLSPADRVAYLTENAESSEGVA